MNILLDECVPWPMHSLLDPVLDVVSGGCAIEPAG